MKNLNDQHLQLTAHATTYSIARKQVEDMLLKYFGKPKQAWHKQTFTYGPKGKKITYSELVEEVKKYGTNSLQQTIDLNDDIFGGMLGMTANSEFAEFTFKYAGYEKKLKTPMTINPVEWELTDDILFYREESCLWSCKSDDLKECTRYYRAYLIACIALIDAFINRHVLMYKFARMKSDTFEELLKCTRLEQRLELFFKLSTSKAVTRLKGGQEWKDFKRLKDLRNEITHIHAPSLGYSIHEFEEHFNLVNTGVGRLLKLIRTEQGKGSLSIIDKLCNAPAVKYCKT